MLSKDYLMLRSAQTARLEARTASLQLIFRCVNQFPDSLFRRDDEGRWLLSTASPQFLHTLESGGDDTPLLGHFIWRVVLLGRWHRAYDPGYSALSPLERGAAPCRVSAQISGSYSAKRRFSIVSMPRRAPASPGSNTLRPTTTHRPSCGPGWSATVSPQC